MTPFFVSEVKWTIFLVESELLLKAVTLEVLGSGREGTIVD